MMSHKQLEHRFVKYTPEKLEPGILYISIEYATAAHSCCCGCGEEVVTPFTPTDWKMTFDGASVSLSPSIGNWNLPCRSHYIIDRGKVITAMPWTDKQVEQERHRDRTAKAKFYGQTPVGLPNDPQSMPTQAEAHSLWVRVWNWIAGRS